MSSAAVDALSPIILEILQNRLIQIVREAGVALQRTAASSTVVESKDLGFNIADHQARSIVYSTWMPRHGTTLSYMLRSAIASFKEHGGIGDGDMILTNHPYHGALHLSDLAVIAPVYLPAAEGAELIAWTGCATHHIDVGGINPGWSPQASNWFQEGIKIPPIKIVEGGRLREDLFQLVLDNVRMPRLQGLDLKAQMVANEVARLKILEVVERYGAGTLKAFYDRIIEFTEMKTRARIRQLPEGRYEAVDHLDFDRLHTLCCTLTVQEGTLTFDFTGTDPQADTFINAVLPCTVANVHNVIICMLLSDIEANEGCFRPITCMVPEGTLLNCRPPAPCSGASTLGGWKAQSLAIAVLSQALAKSPLWERASAAWTSGFAHLELSGRNQYGRWFTHNIPFSSGGGGARATKDGLDVSNIAGSTNTSCPNVESIEQRLPLLFLRRGLTTDSGGPGRYRGGLSGDFVVTLHDVEALELLPFYVGKEIPAAGFLGGLPGSTNRLLLKRGTDVWPLLAGRVPAFEELQGEAVAVPQRGGGITLHRGDVLSVNRQGGGGYGRPVEREPEAVRRDVRLGLISRRQAREAYGVVMGEGEEIDWPATRDLRREVGQQVGPHSAGVSQGPPVHQQISASDEARLLRGKEEDGVGLVPGGAESPQRDL